MRQLGYPLLIAALAIALFTPNMMRGGLMLPLDLLHHLDPFSNSIPGELERVHNPLLWDLAVMIYPWIEEFRRSETVIPLWNPYSFCGSPLLANGQTGLLFPLSWVYRLLPLGPALIVVAVAKLAFCGVFAFYFYRKLEFQSQACLLGAVALMFGALTVVWLGYPAAFSLVTTPFLFWSLQRYLLSRQPRDIAWIAVGYGLLFLGGGLQTALVLSLASALYFVIAARSVRLYPALAVAALLGFCLAAPQLLPFLEYLREGAASRFRGGFGWKQYPWFTLLSWPMPRFFGDPRAGNFWGFSSYLGEAVYIGIAPLLLASVGIILARKDRIYWGILSIAAFGFLGMYAGTAQGIFKRLPFLSHLDNNKLPALVVFAAIFFAVAGLHHLLGQGEEQRRRASLVWSAAALLCVVLVSAGMIYFRTAIIELDLRRFLTGEAILQAAILLSASLIVWLWKTRRLRAAQAGWILLALTSGDLLRLSMYYYPSMPSQHRLPRSESVEFLRQNSGEHRFLGLEGWLPPETSILYGLQDARGIDGHTPFRYYQVIGRIDPTLHDLHARLEAGAPPPGRWTQGTLFFKSYERYIFSEDPEILSILKQLDYWSYHVAQIENPGLLSVLGVKYVIGPKGSPAPAAAAFPLVHSSDADVWENPDCLPRAFISTQPVFAASEAEALEMISTPGFVEQNRAVILIEALPAVAREMPRAELIPSRIDLYSAETVRIDARSPDGGWLVLSDLYYPGWVAYVDGAEAPIYQANYLFRGVKVPPGEHQVTFVYRPTSFRVGIVLSLTAMGIVAALLWLRSGRRRRADI